MDPTKRRIQLGLTTAAPLMGVLAVSGGIYGMTIPQAFASTFGIPVTALNSPAILFVSFAAARNLGSGVSTLVLLANGQTKAVGVLMMCGVVVCVADGWHGSLCLCFVTLFP